MKIDTWELVDERSDEYRRKVYGTVIDEMNQRIAGAYAIPLRILDPIAWRTHRGAQRVARRVRMARKHRRGWA